MKQNQKPKQRKCCYCKQIKPLEEFSTDRSLWWGKSYKCKICHAKNNRDRRNGLLKIQTKLPI